MSDKIQLQPSQLCDLLNYVLGHEQIPQPIEVFVIKTWHSKYGRQRVQRWCEAILRFQGVLARQKLPGSVGRPPCLVPPREIRGFCDTRWIARLQTR